MCQRQDGWVDQLPHPGLSHFFTGAKTQVRNLHRGDRCCMLGKERRHKEEEWTENEWSTVGKSSTPTFRTTWTKSLEFCGVRPWIWRVQASREEAWATIRTVFPV